MVQVWKYILQPKCEIEMPKGSEVLSVAAQGDEICLWAKVDPSEAQKEKRYFTGYGTGHSIPDEANLSFVGTALLHGGSLVFHIFEDLKN